MYSRTLKKLAGTAVKVLKDTIAALPSTATIVKAVSDLLPAIVSFWGCSIVKDV